MSEKPQLDVEMMKRLYDFGGLIAYRVAYVSPDTFETKHGRYTFSEDVARAEMIAYRRVLHPILPIRVESVTIQFNGAFAQSKLVNGGPSQGDGTCS